jgi:hypothetical protein
MQPFGDEERTVLRHKYPNLTDVDMKMLEGLLSVRFALDPETDAAERQALDGQIQRVLSGGATASGGPVNQLSDSVGA